jgi:2-polyprenyl-6-methoxyphenol hydroxylase-like FAD-dependent oxidoreductase
MGSTHPYDRTLDVAVVGGSLGGLCAGIVLKTLGHNVTILERNPTKLLQNQGAGIVAGGDTLEYMKTYDRCNRPIAVQSQARMYLDRAGNVVHRVDMQQNMTSWDLTYYLLRANYDGFKSEYCEVPPLRKSDGRTEYRYDSKVIGVDDLEDQVRVRYQKQDGKEEIIIADLVIGADGPSSTIRKILCPRVERTLAGYCALRGTIPEYEGSAEAKEAFQERFTFFHDDGIQILAYLIPGKNGTIEPGERLINFVWYYNFPVDSQEFADLMTDIDGERHHITMPPGKMQSAVWEKYKQVARDRMPPQFAEVICKTKHPFAQAITDVISSKQSFMDGKVLLIGDALAGEHPPVRSIDFGSLLTFLCRFSAPHSGFYFASRI